MQLNQVFATDCAIIVTSCSNEYVPYLSVCLQSLRENSNAKHNYDIIILESNITRENKNILQTQLMSKNISIRFMHINPAVFHADIEKNCKNKHFSKETFYRILLPMLIPNYKKILYIDVDIIILSDIFQLYKTDLGINTIGACRDAMMNGWIKADNTMKNHLIYELEVKNVKDYFQAGVMLIDCNKFREDNCEEKLITLVKTTNMETADQCILNKYFYKKVSLLDLSWNYENECTTHKRTKWVNLMDQDIRLLYLEARKNPRIIHFVGPEKPWFYKEEDFAELWWKYAQNSPFYSEIIERYNNHRVRHLKMIKENIKLYKFRIIKYKILSSLTFGKKYKYYQDKYINNKKSVDFLENQLLQIENGAYKDL